MNHCLDSFQVISLVRQYGTHLKNLLIYDRVVEAVQRFCANHSIDEVHCYGNKFGGKIRHDEYVSGLQHHVPRRHRLRRGLRQRGAREAGARYMYESVNLELTYTSLGVKESVW